MRLAGIVLAILLIAACPPRRARITYSLPNCPAPVVPLMPTPVPPGPVPAAKAADPAVERLLTEWEKKLGSVTTFRAEIALKRTDPVFKKETEYTGQVLCMRPNLALLRLDNATDPTKADYEAFICGGESLYFYNGVLKTVTEIALPPKWPSQQKTENETALSPKWPFDFWRAMHNPVLDLLTGIKPADMMERFDISVFKSDEHYVYLDIKPRSAKDGREFTHLRLALYGPGEATAKLAYLPAQAYILKPSGDSELWKFSNPRVNLPGIDAIAFQFVEPPKDWKVQKAGPAAEKGGASEPGGP